MFISKTRPVIVPQAEHARLAGHIASVWGNDRFARPALDFTGFVLGVIFHDREYGHLDPYPLDDMPFDQWLALKERALAIVTDNAVADVVVWMHIRRLLGYGDETERRALAQRFDDAIRERAATTPYDMAAYEWADHITALCDKLAFDFAFDAPATGSVDVYTQPDDATPTPVHYQLAADGTLTLTPWPLGVAGMRGFIFGYAQDGYPQRLAPLVRFYDIRPAG
jgi:hypothetical protein